MSIATGMTQRQYDKTADILFGGLYKEIKVENPYAANQANTPDNLISTTVRNRVAATAFALLAVTGVSNSFLSESRPVDAAATIASDFGDVTHTTTLENIEHIADVTVQEVGVVGDKPCGPGINTTEALKRFNSGEEVVKPTETANYLNENPKMEAGFNDFYEKASKNDTRWISEIQKSVAVTSPEILEGHQDTGIRTLKSRQEMRVLQQNIDIQNHQCDPETGKIFPVDNITRLQAGDQVWVINVEKSVLEDMAKNNIPLPEDLIVVGGGAGVSALIMERLACNNPLLEREVPPTPETTTTPTTKKPEATTTTTTAPTTTTTAPTTTTTTTRPTTTTTTAPTTTTTTAPGPKELFCLTSDGDLIKVVDKNGDGKLDQQDVKLTPACDQDLGDPGTEGPVGTIVTNPTTTTSTTRPSVTTTTPTTEVRPSTTLPSITIPTTSPSTTAPIGPGPDPTVIFIP